MLAAVRSGKPELVSFVLDRAVGHKVKRHIFVSLARAAAQGNVDILKLLIERGAAPVNDRAIVRAAGSGSLEAVQLLLDHGFYYPKTGPMWTGDTMDCAVKSGNSAIVRLLQQHGEPLESHHVVTALLQDESPSEEMLQLLAPALSPDVWRECLTSLQRGDVAVCCFLVNHGVDLNITFDSGCDLGQGTALHHAVLYNHEEMARCLLECGARVDFKAKGMLMTALSLARQYTSQASWVVRTHPKRKSTTGEVEKNENGCDGDDDMAQPARKKRKRQKEPSPKMREKVELEAQVRQLAKLEGDAKLDVFTLRQMLRRRGVLAGDLPKRKLPLLQLTVDWLSAGN